MPNLYMIGGPNGAGKTTTAFDLLPELLACHEYVNADSIAAALSPFNPESTAIQAGRLMIERIRKLASDGSDFAFEATMASRSFAPFLKKCKQNNYRIVIVYVWLQVPELAVKRVEERVRDGGHHIPTEAVLRRYERSLTNFHNLYCPLANNWTFYDNSNLVVEKIASYELGEEVEILNHSIWEKAKR